MNNAHGHQVKVLLFSVLQSAFELKRSPIKIDLQFPHTDTYLCLDREHADDGRTVRFCHDRQSSSSVHQYLQRKFGLVEEPMCWTCLFAQIITLSDLEADLMNIRQCCDRLNQVCILSIERDVIRRSTLLLCRHFSPKRHFISY